MKNPCHTCERADQDKSECSITCLLREAYCKFLGIPIAPRIISYNITENKIVRLKENKTKSVLVPVIKKPIPIRKIKKQYDTSTRTLRGMYSQDGLLDKATLLMKQGKTNGEVCRETRLSKTTVAKLRNLLKEQGQVFYCQCGKDVSHKGWCTYRLNKSNKRKEFIKQWGRKEK